jgi:hypothetical protein
MHWCMAIIMVQCLGTGTGTVFTVQLHGTDSLSEPGA